MKKILFFAGLPGSGKSTIAEAVYSLFRGGNYKTEKISIDSFKKEIEESSSDSIDPPEVRWMYIEKALKKAIEFLEKDYEVIIMDEMFHVKKIREQISHKCIENNIKMQWVHVVVNQEIFEQRIQERSEHIMTPEESKKVRSEVEKLFDQFDEEEVTLIENNKSIVSIDLNIYLK